MWHLRKSLRWKLPMLQIRREKSRNGFLQGDFRTRCQAKCELCEITFIISIPYSPEQPSVEVWHIIAVYHIATIHGSYHGSYPILPEQAVIVGLSRIGSTSQLCTGLFTFVYGKFGVAPPTLFNWYPSKVSTIWKRA